MCLPLCLTYIVPSCVMYEWGARAPLHNIFVTIFTRPQRELTVKCSGWSHSESFREIRERLREGESERNWTWPPLLIWLCVGHSQIWLSFRGSIVITASDWLNSGSILSVCVCGRSAWRSHSIYLFYSSTLDNGSQEIEYYIISEAPSYICRVKKRLSPKSWKFNWRHGWP